ncbi:hypothetical protein N7G274_004255 [Stereocaulon virgatum]|uniref:Mid2 domain-containing protein n=1 Tax=Stereocaulon virgatum TaxID=373712 RepID=A0ABR4ACG9_9LECA
MYTNWSRDLIVYSLIIISAALYTVSAPVLVGTFYYPALDTRFYYSNLDVVNASWSTAAGPSNVSLILWCTLNDTQTFQLTHNETIPASGSCLITLDFGTDLMCHFNIKEDDPKRDGPNSGDFYILDAALQSPSPATFAAPISTVVTASGPTILSSSDSISTSFADLSLSVSTVGSSTTTHSPSSLLSSASSSPISLSSSSVASAVPNTKGGKPSGLSTGIKAGIIIAVIASVLISAVNILYCLRRRVKSSRSHASKDSNTSTPELNETACSKTAVKNDAFERQEASGFPIAVSQQRVLREMDAASS